MKKIEMLFYKTLPSEKNTGMKYVLFEVTDDKGKIIHDWGFCDWLGSDWDFVPTPEGYTASVVWWSNTVSPELLLNDSKIIRLGK